MSLGASMRTATFTPILAACFALLAAVFAPASAHNNPSFVETLLLTVPVEMGESGTGESKPFTLELPERSVELIWKVAGSNAEQVSFSIEVDGEKVAKDMKHGGRSKLFRQKTLRIVDVKGAGPVTIEVYADVIKR